MPPLTPLPQKPTVVCCVIGQGNDTYDLYPAKTGEQSHVGIISISLELFERKSTFDSYFYGYRGAIDHFTVSCLVAWSEAGGDLVLIETSLLFSC